MSSPNESSQRAQQLKFISSVLADKPQDKGIVMAPSELQQTHCSCCPFDPKLCLPLVWVWGCHSLGATLARSGHPLGSGQTCTPACWIAERMWSKGSLSCVATTFTRARAWLWRRKCSFFSALLCSNLTTTSISQGLWHWRVRQERPLCGGSWHLRNCRP